MATQATIGIMIATPGRKSLYRTLHSILYQNAPIEDVLVVGDGFHEPTAELVESVAAMGLPCRYVATEKTRDWGHSQLNYALKHVRGTYISYQDDDDCYLPRALTEMAKLVSEFETPRVLIGRVKTPRFGLLWQVPGEDGCLDGHCVVAPNDKKRLGWFDPSYNGDQCYIHTCVRNYKELAWTDRVWTLTRPQWKLWPMDARQGGVAWGCDLYRDDGSGIASTHRVASLVLEEDDDRMLVTTSLHPDITVFECQELAEFMMWACQSKDCWIKVRSDTPPLLEQALLATNFKEHQRTSKFVEYTHDWPPDWWEAVPRFTHLEDDQGKPMMDWRSPWPGKAIT